MTTGTTVTVLVNGVEAADGCSSDDFDQPTVLDNLSVTWGRSDTMSQPQADSCSFEIMDRTGEGFTTQFRTGSRVDVLARGVVDESASTPTFVNPGFETATVTWTTTGGTAARTTERFSTGAYSLNVRPALSTAPVALLLAPAPFVAPGTQPDAWDDIPTTELGEIWTLSVALWVPTGATAQVVPVLFTGPYAAAGTPTADPPRIVTGNDTWQTLTFPYPVAQQAARWLGLQITLSPIGRAWDEMPPALTWDAVEPTLRWDDFGTMYVDDAQITSPASPSAASVLVFSGRVTELSTSWDDSANAPVVAVTANGFTADLENRRVGDEPWNVESVDARSNRILSLADLPITIDIDTSIDETLLSWRDVDTQGALGLLQSVAVSVDAVLWPAVHSAIGAYLRMEDPAMRPALLKLIKQAGLIVIVETDPDAGVNITACDVLRDPVTWIQSVADISTRVYVSWKQQGVDENGLPTTTDVTEVEIDAPLEQRHGTRTVSVSTELQSQADAQSVAGRVLARTSSDSWRAGGVTIDDEDLTPGDDTEMLLFLLDGTSRIGMPIVLTDLPDWTPGGTRTGTYLEGGTYSFTGGRWVLQLIVSAANSGLGASAAWDEMDPTWQWDQFDPGITWNDLRGVSV